MTEDGSHTLYSEKYKQFYHNPTGAISENRHVFFDQPRLTDRITGRENSTLLEAGFGTGLNLLLLLDLIRRGKLSGPIHFISAEVEPVSAPLACSLNYASLLGLEDGEEILASIFGSLRPGWNRFEPDTALTLDLFVGRFEKMPPPLSPLNAILFDPFSPEVNPEFWTSQIFEKLVSWSSEDVLLSTYCASTKARAAMAAAGWKVARAPGAPGKREMTIAALDERLLSPFKRVNDQRLAKRYRSGEFNGSSF
ncbi:MAG: tRNA (5-methylaminomethyl-2-thiouridine)(34)-methyltransferase MnmD [Balneolaceae bacterium]